MWSMNYKETIIIQFVIILCCYNVVLYVCCHVILYVCMYVCTCSIVIMYCLLCCCVVLLLLLLLLYCFSSGKEEQLWPIARVKSINRLINCLCNQIYNKTFTMQITILIIRHFDRDTPHCTIGAI